MPGKLVKQISKLIFQMRVHVYSLFGKKEGGRKAFFIGEAGGVRCGVSLPQRALSCYKRLKKSLFVKFEMIQLLLCPLLGPLTNKHSRVWSFMMDFLDRFSIHVFFY